MVSKAASTRKINRLAQKNTHWSMWVDKARSYGGDLKIVAVDPAFSCGIAFLEKDTLRTCTVYDADPTAILKLMRKEVTPTTVAILEGQFLGKLGTVMKIIERRVMIQTVLRLLGVLCVEVMPSTWQSELLGKPPKKPTGATKGYRTKWLKAESMKVANYWCPPNDDEADAGNIARWANKKIGMPPIKGEVR